MATAADLITIAVGEVGYLEKRSNYQLDNKTANAGYNNYTKYGAWYNGGSLNGQAWCDMFVSWCANQAGCGDAVGCFAYCPSHVAWFRNKGQWHGRNGYTPQPGDIVFFDSDGSGSACHVGIVYAVDGGVVYTIEGNTSGTSGVIANGGGVCKKQYVTSSTYILGYGHPDYDAAEETPAHGEDWQAFNMADGLRLWTNKNITLPVYQTSALDTKIGSISPNEQAWCVGRLTGAQDAFLIYYHVDDEDWYVYKAGWVSYDGGTGW